MLSQKIKSKIGVFKEKTFCIEKSGYSAEDIEDLEAIILSNGGTLLDSSIEWSVASHMIHNDGGKKIPIGNFGEWIGKGLNGKYNVSHRFIYKCIE